MSYRSSRSGYTVRVDGAFGEPDTFVIRARLSYAAALSAFERAMIASRAEMELLLAIAGESGRGRDRGASKVRLALDGKRRPTMAPTWSPRGAASTIQV